MSFCVQCAGKCIYPNLDVIENQFKLKRDAVKHIKKCKKRFKYKNYKCTAVIYKEGI